MRPAVFIIISCLVATAVAEPAISQPLPAAQPSASAEPEILWEVKSRFRLFRYERDFLRHVAADHGDGVLAAEQRLARETDGRGWARTMVTGLRIDAAGRLLDACERDG